MVEEALKRPDAVEKLAVDGSMPMDSNAQQFADYLRSEDAK